MLVQFYFPKSRKKKTTVDTMSDIAAILFSLGFASLIAYIRYVQLTSQADYKAPAIQRNDRVNPVNSINAEGVNAENGKQ